ncbi:MAG: response regulator, partial [Magnetococcales bacterium]|nr:response regulator [Magnetococcales bacterium]
LLTTGLDDRQRHCIEVSHRSGQALLDLISNILDISRIESEQMTLELAPFSLSELVSGVLQILSPLADGKGLSLTGRTHANLPGYVMGDSKRLRQVLINLIGNAIKFTQQGGIWVDVTAGEDDVVQFTVRDSGSGIDQHHLESIFQPFVQGGSTGSGQPRGVGLGLTICRQLIERMGGQIRVDSQLGLGSAFYFTARLPKADAVEEPDSASAMPQHTSGPLRLLVVDDAEENRMVIAEMLRDPERTIIFAHDGAEAVQLFKDQSYDLILMDMMMPVMDGMAATRVIRALEQQSGRSQRTPIVMLTANALQLDLDAAMTAGCDRCLTKPVRRAQLLELIDRLVVPSVATIDTERWNELRDEVGGNFLILVNRFISQLPQRLTELTQAWERGDRPALRYGAHKLRGAASNFGAVRLEQLTAQIELGADTNELPPQWLAQLQYETRQLEGEMRNRVAT